MSDHISPVLGRLVCFLVPAAGQERFHSKERLYITETFRRLHSPLICTRAALLAFLHATVIISNSTQHDCTSSPNPASRVALRTDMDNISVSELVERLSSDEESIRKMAVFKLQSAIGDPSFADVFIYEGGLPKLRFLALHSTGNTLAYCLTSFSRLLELDKGWDHVTDDLIKRVRQQSRRFLVRVAI